MSDEGVIKDNNPTEDFFGNSEDRQKELVEGNLVRADSFFDRQIKRREELIADLPAEPESTVATKNSEQRKTSLRKEINDLDAFRKLIKETVTIFTITEPINITFINEVIKLYSSTPPERWSDRLTFYVHSFKRFVNSERVFKETGIESLSVKLSNDRILYIQNDVLGNVLNLDFEPRLEYNREQINGQEVITTDNLTLEDYETIFAELRSLRGVFGLSFERLWKNCVNYHLVARREDRRAIQMSELSRAFDKELGFLLNHTATPEAIQAILSDMAKITQMITGDILLSADIDIYRHN